MQIDLPPSAETDYHKMKLLEARKNCQVLGLLGVVFFPLFYFLDYFAHTEFFSILWPIRTVTTALFGISYLLSSRTTFFYNKPLLHSWIILMIASLSITLMCIELGIETSPYYAGINLVVLAASLMLPITAVSMALVNISLILPYIAYYLLNTSFYQENFSVLLNNFYFLVSTASIGVVAAHFREKIKKRSFINFYEVKHTKDILQGQLASHKGSLEELAMEVTNKQIELQRALEQTKAAELDSTKAMKLRDEFISIASHELRTPLTVLSLQTELIELYLKKNHNFASDELIKMLDSCYASIDNLSRLVDDMQDVSKIGSGGLHLQKEEVALGELAEKILARFPKAKKYISLDIDKEIKGHWDPLRIEQILHNLVSNAVKYGENKPIEIKVKKEEDEAVIDVIDHGPGIAKELQGNVFKLFDRGNVRKDIGGLGLGLYITKQLVEAHQGKIALTSEVGKGSVFHVNLPL